MTLEANVIRHYARDNLADLLLDTLDAQPEDINAEMLGAIDEFHVGGRAATACLIDRLEILPDMNVLDVGCGLGGAARYVAESWSAHVTGIDLTPEYIDAARILTERAGLAGSVSFDCGNALDLPYGEQSFGAAYTIHAAMNVINKDEFYFNVHRVLKPGAMFGIYDMLAGFNEIMLKFPVPWATGWNSCFLSRPGDLEVTLERAGFVIECMENRRDLGIRAISRLKQLPDNAPARRASEVILGADWKEKLDNLEQAMVKDSCAPWLVVCRRR